MYTVGIDTSHLYLIIALMNEKQIVDQYIEPCLKQQSEYLIPRLNEMLNNNKLSVNDIDQFVVTVGPGSYTGVRIAMTLVKVMGSIVGKKVSTLSTLQLYAGKSDALVLLDARANRCYVGRYRDGQPLQPDCIMTNDKIKDILDQDISLIGDLHLFGKEDNYPHLAENFFLVKNQWQPVENIDILTPVYLKSNREYLNK